MSKDTPWLSVVMPVHHGAAYLADALDSLVGEVDDAVEIILIDSTSDDSCRNIVDTYRDRLRICYSHRSDLGPWQVKTNEAVSRARAPYVAMLHQDDIWLPGRSRAVRAAIQDNADAAMHLFPSRFIDGRGKKVGKWRCPLADRRTWFGLELIKRLLIQNFIAIPAPVIRKADWMGVGGLDADLWYTADWDLYLKLARHGTFTYSRTFTTAFRIHENSLTVTGSRNLHDFESQISAIIDRHSALFPNARRKEVIPIAYASMEVNVALAAAAGGDFGRAGGALLRILRLGPFAMMRYFSCSRIVERVFSRVRAGLGGFTDRMFRSHNLLQEQKG